MSEFDIFDMVRKIERRELQSRRSERLWIEAAEKALALLPDASNSLHPAYSLWLRVELAKQPPMDVVLSGSTVSESTEADQSNGLPQNPANGTNP